VGAHRAAVTLSAAAVAQLFGRRKMMEKMGYDGLLKPSGSVGLCDRKTEEMKMKTWVGCKEFWAKNDFGLPRENENSFEIFWLQI
jgi:hypothetical protein